MQWTAFVLFLFASTSLAHATDWPEWPEWPENKPIHLSCGFEEDGKGDKEAGFSCDVHLLLCVGRSPQDAPCDDFMKVNCGEYARFKGEAFRTVSEGRMTVLADSDEVISVAFASKFPKDEPFASWLNVRGEFTEGWCEVTEPRSPY